MDKFAEIVLEFLVEALKLIFWYVIWCFVLFNFGRFILLLFTLGKYPKGKKVEEDANIIAGTGMGTLFGVWASIVVYNNWAALVNYAT